MTPLDAPTRAMLRQRGWRLPARNRRQLGFALAVAFLLHGWFGWVIWQQMRPRALKPATSAPSDGMLQIRFIVHPPRAAVAPAPAVVTAVAPLQSVVLKPAPGAARPLHAEPVLKGAATVRPAGARPANAAVAVLFDKNGQVILPAPAAGASAAPEAAYVQRMPTDADNVMQHTTPVKYVPTRFEKYWHRTDVVDDTLQKAVDSTTATHTFNLPHGVHIHCSVSLAAGGGGCGGDPPPPPSRKDGDERLSMASAKPIATDPHPPVPPSIEACIALYRADKPLVYGCPIDTPNRSVDKDLADRAWTAAHPTARRVRTPAGPGN